MGTSPPSAPVPLAMLRRLTGSQEQEQQGEGPGCRPLWESGSEPLLPWRRTMASEGRGHKASSCLSRHWALGFIILLTVWLGGKKGVPGFMGKRAPRGGAQLKTRIPDSWSAACCYHRSAPIGQLQERFLLLFQMSIWLEVFLKVCVYMRYLLLT